MAQTRTNQSNNIKNSSNAAEYVKNALEDFMIEHKRNHIEDVFLITMLGLPKSHQNKYLYNALNLLVRENSKVNFKDGMKDNLIKPVIALLHKYYNSKIYADLPVSLNKCIEEYKKTDAESCYILEIHNILSDGINLAEKLHGLLKNENIQLEESKKDSLRIPLIQIIKQYNQLMLEKKQASTSTSTQGTFFHKQDPVSVSNTKPNLIPDKEFQKTVAVSALTLLLPRFKTIIGDDDKDKKIFQPFIAKLLLNINLISDHANQVLRELCALSHPKTVLLVKAMYEYSAQFQLNIFQEDDAKECAFSSAQKSNPEIYKFFEDTLNQHVNNLFVSMARQGR